jgi:uncharacterized LabA/DUF88 family protein
MPPLKTYVYIDGFNFFYGAVKGTKYKWVDFKKLLGNLLDPKKNKILSIKYFTATVSGKYDPKSPIRQKVFIQALQKYIPELSVYYGTFLTHNKKMRLVDPITDSTGKRHKFVKVWNTEEKGSDVNLAVHLLNDAWNHEYDCAVLVSNDSDLAEPMRLIKDQFQKSIGIIIPGKEKERPASKELIKYADFYRRIREGVLKISQLPDPIPGTNIRKPSGW